MTQQSQSLGSRYFDPFYEFKMVVGFIHVFLKIFSTTLIVFLRNRFGERYLDSFTFPMAFLFIMIASSFGGAWAERAGVESSSMSSGLLVLYAWAFLLLGIWHTISARLRRRNGERWHSWCPGVSHLTRVLPFSYYATHRYIEPAVGAIAGYVIAKTLSVPLGMFILWSAAALFAVESIAAREAKTFMLDTIDQQIEQENRAAVLIDRKPVQDTEGYTVLGADALSKRARDELASAASRLDPELQQLMDTQQA